MEMLDFKGESEPRLTGMGVTKGWKSIDNACGASPATTSAQSTKNLDFEGSHRSEAFLMLLDGLWRALDGLLTPLGDLSGASWGPRRF